MRPLVLAILGAALLAAANPPPDRVPPDELVRAEGNFLQEMHLLNVAEVELGKTAQSRATSGAAQALAAELTKDHQAAETKLMAFAAAHGRSLAPPVQDTTVRDYAQRLGAERERLDGTPASAFDQAFIKATLAMHEHAITMVQDARPGLYQSPDYMDLSSGILVMLERHRDAARGLVKNVTH